MWLPVLLLALAVDPHAASAADCSKIIAEGSVWDVGMTATLTVTFPAAVTSWTVEMTFSQALTNFETWAAVASTTDSTTYTLKNNEFDGTQAAGAKVEIEYNAYFDSKPTVTSVMLNGDSQCGDGPSPTTGPPPTGPTQPPPTGPTPGPTQPPPPLPYDYQDVLGKSILFYEAQRSGKLPADNRISWRGDSAMGDGSDVGADLTGGYYDAGDHVKFGFPMAAAATVLAWGMLDSSKGYDGAGQTDHGKQAVKWPADFFVKAHTSATEFYGQCGNGEADHSVWGRAEDMNMDRPSYKISANAPGSDLAGESAAALAAASILLQDSNYLEHAKQLFDFADSNRGIYSDSGIPDASGFYRSSGYGDELAWAAAWLYRATQDNTYLDKAKGFLTSEFPDLMGQATQFSWDDKRAGAQLLMYQLTQDASYAAPVKGFCDWCINSAPKTPQGIIFLDQWGSLRHVGNAAFICLGAARNGLNADTYNAFFTDQLNKILGDTGRSFVVGFGTNPPTHCHHAGASCPSSGACGWDQLNSGADNPQVLSGALVGGPGSDGSYVDDRQDYVKNEVACDYNAGFQSSVAAVLSLY